MLYFLIVNFWSKDLIENLLLTDEFIRHQPAVIVVNNSPQEQFEPATLKNLRITLLDAGGNIGFGPGCNLGLRYIYEKNPQAIVWLLNPDTQLLSGAINYLETCFQKFPEVAILGTRIQDSQGKLWFDRGKFNPWLGTLSHQSHHRPQPHKTPKILPSRWVSGCSLALNLSQFDQLPLFDPNYFLYYEDNDLCERAYQLQYTIAVTQAVLVAHSVSLLTNRDLHAKWRHATFSKLHFLQKHGTFLALILNIIHVLGKAAIDFLRGNCSICKGRFAGLLRFLLFQLRQVKWANKL